MKKISLLLFLSQGWVCCAATLIWIGTSPSSNTPMNVAGNWSPGQVPATGDELIFPGGTPASKSVLNNIGPLTIGNMTIADSYQLVGSAFTIPAGTLTLTYGASGSNINLGGVTLTGTWAISSNAGGNTITSAISGAGNLNLTGGTLLLNGINHYTGTTTLGTGATLRAGVVGSFSPSSSVTIGDGSTLSLRNDAGGTSFSNTIGTLAGTSASMVDVGTATLTVTNSGVNTYSGTITGLSGGFALAATSTGSLTLSGNNSYSTQANVGLTTVGGGTLVAGSANAFGTDSKMTVGTGATLNLNNFNNTFNTLNGAGTILLGSATITIASGGSFTGGVGTGTGGVTLTGGSLSLTGVNTYTGATTIQGGGVLAMNSMGMSTSLVFSSGGGTLQANMPFVSSVSITLNDVGAVNTNGNAVTLSGAMTGINSFMKAGAGTLILSGANSGYPGLTQISGGTLRAGSTTAFGSGNTSGIDVITAGATCDLNGNSMSIGSLSGNVGTFVTLGAATLTLTNPTADHPFYGTISGAGGITVTAGSLALMKPNTYMGVTTLQGGGTLDTLTLGSTSGVVFSTGGGNLTFNSSTSSTAPITINGPAIIGTNTFNVTLSGAITGTGQLLTKIGLGTLTLSGASNMNAGQITIQGGTLNLIAATLGSTTAIQFGSPVGGFNGILQAGGPMTIAIPITLINPGSVDTNGNAVTVSGAISNAGSFTKMGAGTLTLTGANSYAGKTVIEGGMLSAAAAAFSTNSPQLVFAGAGGGVFQLASAYPAFTPSIVFEANGTIDTNGNNMTASGVVAGCPSSSAFTKAGAGILTLSGANIYTGPTAVAAGTLQAGVASTSTSEAFGVRSAVSVSRAPLSPSTDFRTRSVR